MASEQPAFRSVYDLFSHQARLAPDRTFVISLYGRRVDELTFRRFHRRVAAVAAMLDDLGLRRGDTVNLVIQNSAEFLLIYFAAFSRGVVVCPINYNLTSQEMGYIIEDSRGKVLFADAEVMPKVTCLEHVRRHVRVVPVARAEAMDTDLSLEQVVDGADDREVPPPENLAEPSDLAVIIYTSGTSGNPKGVVLTHGNLLADARAIAEWFSFDEGTRTLCILPLFHNNGQVVTLLAPLWAGGSTVMIKGNVSLMVFWDLVARYGATWSSVIPTMLSVLLKFDRKRKDQTMQGIICGGALLPRSVQLGFEERFGVPIFEGYGLTETTSFSSFNPNDVGARKIGSIGRSLPINAMKIVDDELVELGPGEVGEICIKGDNVFSHYCNLPDKTAAAFVDGWFRSGDYGYRDEDGFYFFRERKDYLIIKGGENIYPREIENPVFSHPAVEECVVIGVPHDLWGEEICIFIARRPGASLTREEVIAFCKGRIADFKIPSEVYFVEELVGLGAIPKGPTNKILRRELMRYHAEHLAGG